MTIGFLGPGVGFLDLLAFEQGGFHAVSYRISKASGEGKTFLWVFCCWVIPDLKRQGASLAGMHKQDHVRARTQVHMRACTFARTMCAHRPARTTAHRH